MSLESTVTKKLRYWLIGFEQYSVATATYNEKRECFVLSYDTLSGEPKDVDLNVIGMTGFGTLRLAQSLINIEFKRDEKEQAKDNDCQRD